MKSHRLHPNGFSTCVNGNGRSTLDLNGFDTTLEPSSSWDFRSRPPGGMGMRRLIAASFAN
jgi:hypothetical protein